jgi:hypothetical protein
MNLARHLAVTSSTRDQGKPAFQAAVVFLEIDSEAHVTQERLLVAAIVNCDIDLRLIAENVARMGC